MIGAAAVPTALMRLPRFTTMRSFDDSLESAASTTPGAIVSVTPESAPVEPTSTPTSVCPRKR